MSALKLLQVFIVLVLSLASTVYGEEQQTLEPLLSRDTRLMVFSPHPDDESLGAGGLIQRVLALRGRVKVVFMTNGDGFPEGVEMEDRIAHPTAKDYRRYGEERVGEALKAIRALGVKEQDVVFLGFPDGGLCYLLWKYRADPESYTSPFTGEHRPPPSEMIVPDTDYNGLDLVKEIMKVLSDFRPNLLATTPPEDQHPDHCATYHLVKEAQATLESSDPSFRPAVLTFLIHYGQWPVGQGSGTGSNLNVPDGFPAKTSEWISLSLRPEESKRKRQAILDYHTQMLVMGRFLLSFARANELYRKDSAEEWENTKKKPCCGS